MANFSRGGGLNFPPIILRNSARAENPSPLGTDPIGNFDPGWTDSARSETSQFTKTKTHFINISWRDRAEIRSSPNRTQ